MREIKFRAWDKELGFMVDPEGGYFVEFDGAPWFDLGTSNGGDYLICQAEKLAIMQYTGLKDKNGKEMFEGDILSMWYAPRASAKGLVIFKDGSFMFETKEAVPYLSHLAEIDGFGNYVTVIGNIYENPELIEG